MSRCARKIKPGPFVRVLRCVVIPPQRIVYDSYAAITRFRLAIIIAAMAERLRKVSFNVSVPTFDGMVLFGFASGDIATKFTKPFHPPIPNRALPFWAMYIDLHHTARLVATTLRRGLFDERAVTQGVWAVGSPQSLGVSASSIT